MILNAAPIKQADLNYISQELTHYESASNNKIVFGSVIGSISQGLDRPNSDVDVRYLYVDKSACFIDSKYRHDESRVRHRVIDKDKRCNCVALWEISAFLNFLYEPYLDSGDKYKLVRNVIWTFSSPYTYDPYGLQIKLLPLIQRSVDLRKEYKFHVDQAKINYNNALFDKTFKSWVYAIYHLLSCRWILAYNSLSPISICTLLSLLHVDMSDTILGFVNRLRINGDYILLSSEESTLNVLADQLFEKINNTSPIGTTRFKVIF